MNLFDLPDEDYANKSKIRIRDASMLAQKIRTELDRKSDQVNVIVDLGCGTGYSTLELAARFPNARVIGIDVNQTYIEHAPLMAKNVEFYCADISEIGNFSNFCTATDLAESSVNIVISTYWLSCLTPAAKAAAIGNMKRLLQPDGYLYILDLVWTDAYAIIHKLNHSDPWQAIIKEQKHSIGQNSAHQLELPQSETAPNNEQVSNQWIEQFAQFDELELFQIVRNKLYYRFQSMDDMMHVLDSICVTLPHLDETQAHKYFVEFVRAVFDQCFIASNNLKLGYVNLQVVAHKKGLESGSEPILEQKEASVAN